MGTRRAERFGDDGSCSRQHPDAKLKNIGCSPISVSGFLLPLDDVAQLAARLEALIASPAVCNGFGEAGYEGMRADYTWQNTGAQTATRIWQELQSQRRPARIA